MKRVAYVLAGLLCLQGLVALALSLSGPDFATYKATEPLVSFNSDRIDDIKISEAGGSSVQLTRSKDGWAIKEFVGFPADKDKVTNFLSKLRKLKMGWPVAETSDAAKRFKVAENDFERRVELKAGGTTIGEIYFGTSPALRQTHARIRGDAKIFSVEFESHEAAARGDNWLDRDSLTTSRDKVASIAIGDFKLTQAKNKEFKLADLKADETAKPLRIATLVRSVLKPVFDAIDGKGEKALAKLDNPDATATITMTDGTTTTIRYKAQDSEGKAYLFAPSGQDYVFRASAPAVEDVVKANRAGLIVVKKAPDDETPATKSKDAETTDGKSEDVNAPAQSPAAPDAVSKPEADANKVPDGTDDKKG